MYCKKCRNKINNGWKYCPYCQNILNNETVELDERKILEEKKKEEKESIIYIILFLVGIVGGFLLNGSFFLLSLISIVTGYIKCPNSKIIKILFWVFLICIILYLFAIVLLLASCFMFFNNC